jgi:hypothetical protein
MERLMNLFKPFLAAVLALGVSFLFGCEKELKEHPLPESVKRRLEMANDPEVQKKKVTGTIQLPADVSGKVPSNASLFIFARPVGVQGGPPLAVKRLGAVNFPFEFNIGQMDTMLQGADFSGKVTISARLDGDGVAGAGPGDVEGKVDATVGDTGVEIVLNQVVGDGKKSSQAQTTSKGDQAISGTIKLGSNVKDPIPEDGALFVFVRPEGVVGGPPLAVKRMAFSGFPQSFSISEKDAMRSTARFEGNLTLAARLDQDGDARSAPGDIEGSLIVQGGNAGIELVLDKVVGAPVEDKGGSLEPVEPKSITGTINLDPKIAEEIPVKDLRLFIILRPKGQTSGPPMAVQLFGSVEFPLPFEIGQKDAMMPGTTVEGPVEVIVRIDRDGNAKSSPGDLEGQTQAVVGDKDIKIVLNKKV